jgi:hypothetical protein
LLASQAYAATDPRLVGCWLNDKVIQSGIQGIPKRKPVSCALYFDLTQVSTACPSDVKPNAFTLIRYSYEVTASGEYVAKVVQSDEFPKAIGTSLKFMYQVDAKSLFLLTFPQTATPIPFGEVMREETISLKVAAKNKDECLFKAVEKATKAFGV